MDPNNTHNIPDIQGGTRPLASINTDRWPKRKDKMRDAETIDVDYIDVTHDPVHVAFIGHDLNHK